VKNAFRVALFLIALAAPACDEAGLTDPPTAPRCDPEIARADRDTDEDLARCFGGGFRIEGNDSRAD
jgi:hypothetical protein